MCAIGGICLYSGESLDGVDILKHMVQKQKHRGPDSNGIYWNQEQGVGFCHNRLAILDVSNAGQQPMHSHDGTLTIVFNGEIYNWKLLRAELKENGFHPKTGTDTEVLLEMYRKYGVEMLPLLRGMFAFSIYDHKNQTIFCARDRVGKKPFLYAETKHGVVFSSELPALLSMPDCDTSINESSLANMLLHNLRHIPDPYTVYKGVMRLRAGHAMIIKEGKIEKVWRYWSPKPNSLASDPDYLRNLLEESVQLRMVADVPVGALLSGGVDSTAIVHLMNKYKKEPVRTYAFGADEYDEDILRARLVSRKLGTQHKEFYFNPVSQFEMFKSMLAIHGEPIMLLPLIHAYQLCDAIHNDGIKVVLNGNGADELFYGYTGHLNTANITKVINMFGWLRHITPKTNHSLLSVFLAEPGKRKAEFYRRKGENLWPNIFRPEIVASLENLVAEEMEMWGGIVPNSDFIDESNYLSLLIENTHSVTIASDLPGMMASVEMRAPFLDQEIINAAMGIHFTKKVKGPKDGSQLKNILRKAVMDLVPPEVMHAPKRGFGMGVQERDVLLGPWQRKADKIFLDFPMPELFNSSAIRTMWLEAKNTKRGQWDLLAKLFAIGLWKREV